METKTKHWAYWIEKNTGEVPIWAVSDYLGIPDQTVMTFVAPRHGARYVGGTSGHLIWQEDAKAIVDHYEAEWAKRDTDQE